MKFNSQICTTREQSERLLSLGLRKETADMFWMEEWKVNEETCEPYFTGNYISSIKRNDKWIDLRESIPAWSLARLVELIDEDVQIDKDVCCLDDVCFTINDNLYDNIIDCIEWLIKKGYFNKEYLENGN